MLTYILMTATLVAVYWFWIRPILRSRPAFQEFYEHEDSLFVALCEKLIYCFKLRYPRCDLFVLLESAISTFFAEPLRIRISSKKMYKLATLRSMIAQAFRDSPPERLLIWRPASASPALSVRLNMQASGLPQRIVAAPAHGSNWLYGPAARCKPKVMIWRRSVLRFCIRCMELHVPCPNAASLPIHQLE
jgi:hypothetical protein